MDFSWLSDPYYQESLWTGLINTLVLLVVSAVLGFTLAAGLVDTLGDQLRFQVIGWAAAAPAA